ncbi:MAG: hypothetical protein ACM30G_14465 [Micromonosporaceae bacterium]
MTDPMEHAVRVAVRQLAAEARPAALTDTAVAAGRQLLRRRRIAGAVLTAAAVIAAIGLPHLPLPADRSSPRPGTEVTESTRPIRPTTSAEATPTRLTFAGPISLPGGWTILSTGFPGSAVWNRDRRAYEGVNRDWVLVAPAGPYAAAAPDDPTDLTRVEILDLRGRNPRTVSLGRRELGSAPQWSPDGTRLLLTTIDTKTPTTFITILDAGSGDLTSWPIDKRYLCTGWCRLTWTRDGTEVVWPLTDRSVPHDDSGLDPRSGLQLFSATDGHPTRTLPVRGDVSGPFAWSPTGRYVIVAGAVVSGGQRTQKNWLVDVGTGAVVRTFPDGAPYWIANDRLLLAGGGLMITLVDPTGAPLALFESPAMAALLGPA